MFRRKPQLTQAQVDLLVQVIDREIANSLDSIGGFGTIDVRRVMREYIEALDAVRATLVRLNQGR